MPTPTSKFHLLKSVALIAILLSTASCRGPVKQAATPTTNDAANVSANLTVTPEDQVEVLKAQREQDHRVEVTVTAKVLKMLPEDTRGIPHEQFLLILNNGTTVKVAHDTAMAERVPLQAGDVVHIHGEYIWNEKGGVIHWTHHSDSPRHPGGYIDFNGKRYQ